MLLREFFIQTPGKYFAQDKARVLQKFAKKIIQICLEQQWLESLHSMKSTKSDLQEF